MQKRFQRRAFTQVPSLENFHPVLARVYAARGIQSTEELDYRLTQLTHYQSLRGIDKAAELLATALKQQRRILVVGDFDSDGATSSALAVSALRAFGATHVDFLVPNRFEYGYGLSPEIVAVALAQKQPDLIITVDNGIANHDGVLAAKQAGCQVIITDHHLPGLTLPEADAIVNPQQPGDTFPSKHLAGVGVIFYVMLALRQQLRQIQWFDPLQRPEPKMTTFLDLVALGTVADLVTLDHNNRLLVHQGLQWIQSGQARPGIYALLKLAKRSFSTLRSSDLGYSVAPRLNAAGRLADMSLGVKCLLAETADQAHHLAVQLTQLNEERRVIEADMQRGAWQILEKKMAAEPLGKGVCLFSPDWHQGVIGLLASRITERWYRPSIVFAPSQPHSVELKGSARSIPGVHIRDVLAAIAARSPTLIQKFGGHAMAAGLTLNQVDFAAFSEQFQQELDQCLDETLLQKICYTDGELTSEQFSLSLAKLMHEAGPWGQGFPEPVFEGRFRLLTQRLVGNKHLKMTLALEQNPLQIEAIAFNVDLALWPNQRTDKIRATYRLDINEYQGRQSVQLIVEWFEPVSSAAVCVPMEAVI